MPMPGFKLPKNFGEFSRFIRLYFLELKWFETALSLELLVGDFKKRKIVRRFRRLIKIFKVFLKAFRSFMHWTDTFFYVLLGPFTDMLLEVEFFEAVARRVERKFRLYGFVWPFKILRLVKLWATLFEEFGWRFWWIWCETIFEAASFILQTLAFFHLLWIFDRVFKWIIKKAAELLLKLSHCLNSFISYGDHLGWDKFFLSILAWTIWFCLMNKGFILMSWAECKRIKKMCKKKIKYIRGWKKRARKSLRSHYRKAVAPLKFYWSLINWERQPMKFFWKFYSAFSEQLRRDIDAIKLYYRSLLEGILGKFLTMTGTESWIAYRIDTDFTALGFIPGLFWLLYYLTIIANGVYWKYLTVKFTFFSFKYLLRWAFFLIDFPLEYFFGGTIIYKLHSVTIKLLYRLVNFFIFRGIPFVLSVYNWIDYVRATKAWVESRPKLIKNFLATWREKLNKILSRLSWWWFGVTLYYYAFANAIKKVANRLKYIALKVKKFFKKRYIKVYLAYNIKRRARSERGLLFWEKLFKPRIKFLVKNVKEKSLKFWRRILTVEIEYNLTKAKLIVNREVALKLAFCKYKIAVFLDWKIHYHKAFIIYCKFVRLLSFICLNFVKLLIKAQCFYFALRGKFNEFRIHNGFEKEIYNVNLIISQLEDKMGQNGAIKVASQSISGNKRWLAWWKEKWGKN